MFASENGHFQVVELLLKENADPNLQTKKGSIALTSVSQNGHYQIVELLLNGKADPNHQTQKGFVGLTIVIQMVIAKATKHKMLRLL